MASAKTTAQHTVLRTRRNNLQLRRACRIEAFHEPYRHAIHAVSVDSPAIEDLAASFPALLFALASGYGTARARAKTRKLVENGATLRKTAATLGLPYWLRKLPPSTFTGPIGALPSGPGFDNRLAQLAPDTSHKANAWLGRVSYAHDACHENFALWVARQQGLSKPADSGELLPYLAAWAWFTDREDTLGHHILRKPWTSAMGLRRASEEMSVWRRRIAMVACLGPGVTDAWIDEGRARGYEFVALRTIEDFIAESMAMDNCLDQYAEHLENGVTRIFSVRKNGKPVADIEIGPHEEEPRMPALQQVRGPRNRRAPPEVWRAIYAWLGSRPVRLMPSERSRYRTAARRREARKAFWQPYLDALDGSSHQECCRLLVLGKTRQRAALTALMREAPTATGQDAPARLAAAPR